jgi:hypothetical protein
MTVLKENRFLFSKFNVGNGRWADGAFWADTFRLEGATMLDDVDADVLPNNKGALVDKDKPVLFVSVVNDDGA